MLKIIHILGAVMFLGGIGADLVWMKFAEQTKKPSVLAFASKTVTLSDFLVALPGAGLLILSGVPMILASTEVSERQFFPALLESLQIGWLFVSIVLLNISGAVWLFLILPRQRRMMLISEEHISSESLPSEFFQALRKWYFWGMVATVMPFVALVLMILKPRLW